jgi:hypothetical protein
MSTISQISTKLTSSTNIKTMEQKRARTHYAGNPSHGFG